ncbi:type II toxin-antitoxin system RelE/ParE family toxin [Aerosakkonemataceae cyanobacterium BLCC-F50]|uniref:Type II toxin-antitoxin system RelE/ParE family toxin n=1 Tax=Floridaenema flaviceps BLCC-F50 TaxID=3153642 RepID=A0ABV4Y1P4_9CYAN
MNIEYRTLFLRDLKKLRKQEIYSSIYELVFTTLPEATSIQELPNVKALAGTSNRYRIRVGDYRIGFEVNEDGIELMRVLHRKEFYRYFP